MLLMSLPKSVSDYSSIYSASYYSEIDNSSCWSIIYWQYSFNCDWPCFNL